ncbi:MAG: ADP-ribosylglycohydrolase family protein [Faecalicoccus sp.]|nr:ADP-ribosylglycohydrolase family protein [Faecalicoccus sp.]
MNTKTIDGVFGLAVADALGVPAEFKSRKSLKENPITDMVGYGTHHQPAGTWSDDTSMTIATMDSIIDKQGINYDDMMVKFSDWMHTAKYTAGGVFFDIGGTTRSAIHNFERGNMALYCGEPYESANGNGSLMRILPVVLYCYYKKLSHKDEVEIINNASSITHAHEISKLGCMIYADYIKEILKGNSLLQAYDNLNSQHYSRYYKPDTVYVYQRVLDGSLANLKEDEIHSSGFVVHTLEAAIWCNLTSNSYKEAVLKAVNLGDDTDTVAAVAGSIAGIYYGYESIPESWRNTLINREYLMDLCQKFDEYLGS